MRNDLTITAVLALCSVQASAQDALGTGRALDNNLSVDGIDNRSRSLPKGTTNDELRGNAILSGRSFGEGVGFDTQPNFQLISDAENEGGGALADAMNNSPWYWDNWNNQSAQFLSQGDTSYFNPNFIDNWAKSPTQMRMGRNIQSYSRAWKPGEAKADESSQLNYPSNWSTRQVNQHRLAQSTGSTYEPSLYDTSAVPIGNVRTSDTVGYYVASPLRGISLETSNNPASIMDLSAWDSARALEDRQRGVGSDNLVNRWVTSTGILDNRADSNMQTGTKMGEILSTVNDRAQEQLVDSTILQSHQEGWLDQRYNLLQGQLAGTIPFDEDDSLVIAEDDEGDSTLEDNASDEIAFILKHGIRIDQLASGDGSRFNELIALAEEKIAQGEYFWAERRFDRALRFIPGHPLAIAGLGHSRIGAGLYLSASLALQSLLSLQPEMIDVEYSPSLLPPHIELVKTAVKITSRLEEERDGGTYAFLLAYIGHQLSDQEMIKRGLEVFEEREGSNDPLVLLLKRIWL